MRKEKPVKKISAFIAAFILAASGLSAAPNPYRPDRAVPAGSGETGRSAAMVFARFGSFSPNDDAFKSIYGSGLAAGLEGRIRVFDGLYFSLEGGIFRKTGALSVTGEETTLSIVPLDALAVYHFRLPGAFSPYIGAGGSLCLYTEKNPLGDVKDHGFGPAFCAGTTVRLGILGLDARIKYSSVKIKPFEIEAGLGGLTLSFAAGVVF